MGGRRRKLSTHTHPQTKDIHFANLTRVEFNEYHSSFDFTSYGWAAGTFVTLGPPLPAALGCGQGQGAGWLRKLLADAPYVRARTLARSPWLRTRARGAGRPSDRTTRGYQRLPPSGTVYVPASLYTNRPPSWFPCKCYDEKMSFANEPRKQASEGPGCVPTSTGGDAPISFAVPGASFCERCAPQRLIDTIVGLLLPSEGMVTRRNGQPMGTRSSALAMVVARLLMLNIFSLRSRQTSTLCCEAALRSPPS